MPGLRPLVFAFALLAAACTPEGGSEAPAEQPVRGLITQVVRSTEDTMVRRFPGVLEPAEVTALSFKVSGRLGEVNLSVGQTVEKDQLLASIDATTFENTVEDRRAAVDQAQALLEQAQDALSRQQTLFERNVVSRVAVQDAQTEVRSREAQLTQAQKSLATAEQDLNETKLFAPFAGLVNAVEVESFQTVGIGDPIVSLYSAGSFEVSFSVNFTVASRLVVGTPAKVRLADDPDTVLDAVVSELGERADTVSSFPAVVSLTETAPFMKAGMAVEVALQFSLPAEAGYLVPISAAALDRRQLPDRRRDEPAQLAVFVFDPDTDTVRRREVTMAGIRENQLLIIDGLEAGERVAVAGVTFLRDGMQVKLVDRDV